MAVVDGRTWLEHLSVPDCWKLLSETTVGRVGVMVDSAPEIYPVNYATDDHTVLFRTDPGSKLRGLAKSPSVCFEIDALNLDECTGWSVLVKGWATALTDPEDVRRAAALPLPFWTLGDKTHWIQIHPVEVTGRRIHRPGSSISEP